MKNLNSGSQLESAKYRHHLGPGASYQNVLRGTLRPIGIDFTLPNCTGRRSAPCSSTTHTHHGLWQERHLLRTPVSCIDIDRKPPSSKGKASSIALAIASFIVLTVVLAIAGLALYLGISSTDSTTNAIITFSCSAKVLKGDRFVGVLGEKALKYRRQIEVLYQRSALGPALVSTAVDRFGKDGVTIYFRLAFNRRKLVENLTNIENTIKDIFLSDSYSKKPIFRNIRFDPKSVTVTQVQKRTNHSSIHIQASHTASPKSNAKSDKMRVVLKSGKNSTELNPVTTAKPIIKNEEDLPLIQGSYKITKTEADITERKTEAGQYRVTSAPTLYEVPGDNGRNTKILSSVVPSSTTPITSIMTAPPTATSTTKATTETTPSSSISTTKDVTETTPKFKGSPQVSDEEPWVPILQSLPGISTATTGTNENVPIYTSFTNPGFNFHFQDSEHLGSTSIKSHPIPVFKVPFTEPFSRSSTEFTRKYVAVTEITTNAIKTDSGEDKGFVQIETVEYNPNEPPEIVQNEHQLKNITSVFYNLASTLDKFNASSIEQDIYQTELSPETKEPSVQGQAEVVEVDVEELLTHTTKIPLVTLLPVRSNSGISRPFNRNRYGDHNNLSVVNRSFHSQKYMQNLDMSDKPRNRIRTIPSPINVSTMDNYKIMGVLNFAREGYDESESRSPYDIVRFPKMDLETDRRSQYSDNHSPFVTFSNVAAFKTSNILTPEQLRQLSEISKLHNNDTYFNDQPITSTRPTSLIYSMNHNGLKILTKTFNKFPESFWINDTHKRGYKFNNKERDCEQSSFKCGDGKCLPESTKCNQLIDCADGTDEENCNCADYLKSQLSMNKICDGVVDCWDFSDENHCRWCSPEKYVCGNSKVCVDRDKICDGLKDCPHGDDERQCVTIAGDSRIMNDLPYYSEGYLMVRKRGSWGKLCLDNFENVVSKSHISWEIADLGTAICKSMTYQKMDRIQNIKSSNEESENQQYFELAYAADNKSEPNLLFKESECPTKTVIKVTCEALECGARPQAVKHIARVVGGGNAGLGAWPWQVALYKEGEFQCGATLLSDRWLVSAGHCFYRSPKEHWVARLGALRRGTTLSSPYEQLRTISRIIVHPGYLDFGFINDISLLQMESPVVFSDYVRPVCLPPPDQVLKDGHLCTVIGWGQLFEVGRIFPDTLQEVQIPVISTAECRKRTLFLPLYKITDDMFCAGFDRGGRDACLGDSGGPLMCPEPNGRWTLHGITSNGYGCARANRPGVYTKVASYVDWINSYIHGNDTSMENIPKIVTTCPGHRCPLGECLPESRLCNGFIECSDGSDEKQCKKNL